MPDGGACPFLLIFSLSVHALYLSVSALLPDGLEQPIWRAS
jgi:hypothetical protein